MLSRADCSIKKKRELEEMHALWKEAKCYVKIGGVTNESIKEKLLELEESELDFSVIQTGKKSKKVNGLYNRDTREILLHNKNFTSDEELLYTAIHEYAHHLESEEELKKNGGTFSAKRPHNKDFYFRFNSLLEKAKEKGVYTIDISSSPELVEITKRIKNDYIKEGAVKMIEFGKLLMKAHELCKTCKVRYEDYVERVLKLPRLSEKSIVRVAQNPSNPEIGFENMKMLSLIKNNEEKKAAQEMFLNGDNPLSVRAALARKDKADEGNAREKLLREKNRLEKTIETLTKRLENLEREIESL